MSWKLDERRESDLPLIVQEDTGGRLSTDVAILGRLAILQEMLSLLQETVDRLIDTAWRLSIDLAGEGDRL